jgi:hypothetical protein
MNWTGVDCLAMNCSNAIYICEISRTSWNITYEIIESSNYMKVDNIEPYMSENQSSSAYLTFPGFRDQVWIS